LSDLRVNAIKEVEDAAEVLEKLCYGEYLQARDHQWSGDMWHMGKATAVLGVDGVMITMCSVVWHDAVIAQVWCSGARTRR
jgi:hypothetical protein